MIIDCISDLHGHYPKLEGGDLLIVAGDLTAHDELVEHYQFGDWLKKQNYKKKIVIAGNHDNRLQKLGIIPSDDFHHCSSYLYDSGTEFVYYPPLDPCNENDEIKTYERPKLKIWGSPWTLKFDGMNPHCMAFTCDTEEELAEKWTMIPDDIDILVTHGPPYGIYDAVEDYMTGKEENVGSKSLTNWIAEKWSKEKFKKLKIHVFGHIHEHGGKLGGLHMIQFINASHVNEYYEPVNKPIRVIL
jgi:Icc-related predicted phosphoesterase